MVTRSVAAIDSQLHGKACISISLQFRRIQSISNYPPTGIIYQSPPV